MGSFATTESLNQDNRAMLENVQGMVTMPGSTLTMPGSFVVGKHGSVNIAGGINPFSAEIAQTITGILESKDRTIAQILDFTAPTAPPVSLLATQANQAREPMSASALLLQSAQPTPASFGFGIPLLAIAAVIFFIFAKGR